MKMIRLLVCLTMTMLVEVLVAPGWCVQSPPITAGEDAFPVELKVKIQALDEKGQSDSNEEVRRRKNVARDVIDWVSTSILKRGHEETREELGRNDLLASKGEFSSWKDHFLQQARRGRKGAAVDLKSSVASGGEVVVIQVDYKSYNEQPEGYMVSAVPGILLVKGGEVFRADVGAWKYAQLGAVSSYVVGFVDGGAGRPSDVLIAVGPVGSGSFLYMSQFHFDEKGKEWRVAWETQDSLVVDVRYAESSKEVSVTRVMDKFSGGEEKISYYMKWGGTE